MTVSRVLTGSAKVKESTTSKVRKAIDLLRYEPNEVARELRSHPVGVFGLALPGFREPSVALYADAVQRAAEARQHQVTLFSFQQDVQQHRSVLSRAAQRGLRKVLLISGSESVIRLSARDLETTQVVMLGHSSAGAPIASVTAQERQGARVAVQHLLEHGLQQIVFLYWPGETPATTEKLEGYRDAMSFVNLPCFEQVLSEPSDLVRQLRATAAKHSDSLGVVTAGMSASIVLMRALHADAELQKRVRFISLEDWDTADLFQPPVTTVRHSIEEMSALAVDLLLDGMDSLEPGSPGPRVSVPVELVVRSSCGCTQG